MGEANTKQTGQAVDSGAEYGEVASTKKQNVRKKVTNTSIINTIRECVELGAVIVAIVVALACFIGAIGIIKSSLESIHTTTDVISKIGQTVNESISDESGNKNENLEGNADSLLEYKERMLTIQKNSLNNDLMSFIYGVMSTILVGLCAYFVEKSEKTAREARENVVQIQSKADAVGKTISDVKSVQEQLKKALEEANNQNVKLQNSVRILSIQKTISQARSALYNEEMSQLNNYLPEIENAVCSLSKETLYDKDAVSQLVNDLEYLNSEFGKAKERIENDKKRSQKMKGDYTDRFDSFVQSTKDAIDYCNAILATIVAHPQT